ncbi:hypothetical protein [Thiohalocapsa sp. ML1]|jgi:hypothetical protein|uniref:hypothetical protein n=1 Tax=Thiohalocapsa sp. ML1 TaxID=1431688 RepID=UPI000AA51D50|nr:hypothetical protein [Thiohalocapsa sp. ML1]
MSESERVRSAVRLLFAAILSACCGALSAAGTDADDDWPDWAREEQDLMEQIAAVNEGDLHFLPAERAVGEHNHLNRIRITRDSLDGGWVTLEQCHENIDAVPAAQILFRAGGIRDLTIASSRNIGRAWVEGHSVQLENVGAEAVLCIQAESQALSDLGDGHYRLRNGPYMRRFLDGYYPMRVTLDIEYPAELIEVVGQSPASQPGFSVRNGGSDLSVDATFEGRLITCFDFCRRGDNACASPAPACEEG